MFERYRAKKEVEGRIKDLRTTDDKVDYLRRMLSKKSLLSPTTREAIYSELGDLNYEISKGDEKLLEMVKVAKEIVFKEDEVLFKELAKH